VTEAPAPKAEPTSSAVAARLEAFGYVGAGDLPASTTEAVDAKDLVDVVEHYRAAADEAAAGRWQPALERYRALAQLRPELVDVWMHAGQAAFRLERSDVAAEAFMQAAHRAPLRSDAQLGAAFAYLRLRNVDEARRHAQAVLDTPQAVALDQSSAHEVLARAAFLRRDFELAHSEAELAEQADPTRPVAALIDARMAFDRKHYAEAIEPLQSALTKAEARPDAPLFHDLRLLTAETLNALQRYSEAEYLFLEELKVAPRSARARAGLTVVYKATGRPAEAAALAH
jgi:tetratricopeptide (TPR) repeat protein